MRLRQLWLAAILALVPVFSHAQVEPAMLDKIIDEGMNRNQSMNTLRYLCKRIGTRLTSSENLDKAYAWTQKRFKEFGCVNVHLEQWGEWPVGFQRGKSSGAMVSPEKLTFEFTTPSWTEGTRGKKKGQAIYAPTTMDEFNAMKDKLKGAWLIYKASPPRTPRVRPGETPPELTPEQKAAQELATAINGSGILGRVMASRSELVVTSGSFRDKTLEDHPMDVSVTIRKSDMDKVIAHLDKNEKVELEFNLNQKFIKGPRKLYNVVAEIPGTEKPDEIVIVGGHLDSWDGPGSEGAADNGTGTTIAMEVARILNKVGAKPKRTIRFVLFTGEEQGLFGSSAYVQAHKDEWSKISCAIIEDNGANYQSGTYVLESMRPFWEPIIELNNKTFPDMPMKLRVLERMPRGGASDHAPFNGAGIPGFFWDKAGTQDYNYIHHTQYDTFERVPEKYMIQMSVNQSIAAYYQACWPSMMPRAPIVVPPTTPPQ